MPKKPTTAEDAVLMALDEVLVKDGYRSLVFQPCADALVASTVEALWMDDATLVQAATSAVARYESRLVREEGKCGDCCGDCLAG